MYIADKSYFTILLADDDEGDRLLFSDVADEIENIRVLTVKNGVELLNKLKEIEPDFPDVIFLDLNMPIKDGHQCLKEIKSNIHLSGVPVAIYSTSTNKEHLASTYANGANLYIAKPDSYTSMKNIIKTVAALPWQEYIPQPPREKFMLDYAVREY